ncbi:caspase-1-like isoform X2 [Micropterus salmoides]|uniref:caspase-1-like isoform X1 n=1 Tax=Micropterus salmoides TaxID=27706 RepID=UPI0018EB6A7B|nr:caspase-1-like isoform X1 [Micropterus salmoides]XP_038550296.1 caspase-1-like isoform X2 [Micropterus salmoides]
MAEELHRVRKKFVDKASKELINQLLDDILEDGIVNNGEKDSMIAEKTSRADKARCLIDTVKKKGNEASRKLIAHLQSRDPTLYNELGLSSGPPPPAPLEAPKEQNWSNALIPTTEAFWCKKQNDRNIYPAAKSSIRNRVALLITNIKFTNEKLNRRGAEKDEANMEKLLTSLGYEVVKHTNLTGKAINDSMINFSKHPKLKETDSVMVVIMSHGKLGAVLGINHDEKCDDEFPINNIYKHLGSEKCPALLNKPKIIIIQACRGDEGGSVLVSDAANSALVCDDVKQPSPSPSAGDENLEDDALRCVHKEKDFISLLSSTPETVSYRHPEHGSLLIQYVVMVLNTFAHEDDIDELFRKVMQRFEDFSIQSKRQMPTKDRCTLTRRFYFFPGL